MMRRLGAVVAAGVVLCGCASGTGAEEPTTSPSAAEASGNPWDLPLEQRPPLFDPCSEIPVATVEAGVGSPVTMDDEVAENRPGELIYCTWRNKEMMFTVLSTWKSREEYLKDPSFEIESEEAEIAGRTAMRLVEPSDARSGNCYDLFFTKGGAVMVGIRLLTSLNEFRGNRLVKSCDALNQAIDPVVPLIPEGNFR
jgi:hypothetical protein